MNIIVEPDAVTMLTGCIGLERDSESSTHIEDCSPRGNLLSRCFIYARQYRLLRCCIQGRNAQLR